MALDVRKGPLAAYATLGIVAYAVAIGAEQGRDDSVQREHIGTSRGPDARTSTARRPDDRAHRQNRDHARDDDVGRRRVGPGGPRHPRRGPSAAADDPPELG